MKALNVLRHSHRFSSERRSAWKTVEGTKSELNFFANTEEFPSLSEASFKYTPEGPRALSRTSENKSSGSKPSTDWGTMVEEYEAQNQIAKRKLVLADKTERENRQGTKPKRPTETDEEVLARRQKQIDYGKNTAAYWTYVKQLPRSKRSKHHPKTPSKYQVCSRRSFDAQVKNWKKQLHLFTENPDASGTTSTHAAGGGRIDLLFSDTSSESTESVEMETRMDVDGNDIDTADYPTPPNSQEDAHPTEVTPYQTSDPNQNLPWSDPNNVMNTLMAACQVTNNSIVYDYKHGMDNFPLPTKSAQIISDNHAKNFMDEFDLDECLRKDEDADNFNL
ncbi:histone RNA hairpin-binding protein-like isoform X1 [Ptychodera flava]|uniref:histone RNA hairpin-binding protein-like isoform X1 n=1 Tax=Ptychodera flava TaxID=63121 RepID=UPI00396A311A